MIESPIRLSIRELCPVAKHFAEAYLEMARVARYRPEAPTDRYGNVAYDARQMRNKTLLENEAVRYAQRLDKQDQAREFRLHGFSEWSKHRILVYLLNAARLCFSDGPETLATLKRLLVLSLTEIESLEAEQMHKEPKRSTVLRALSRSKSH